MRVAALYDIHGNQPALEAVLADVRREGVDRIVVGGDVFPGPMCSEALAILLDLDLPVHFLLGNGDRETLALAAGEPVAIPEPYLAATRWTAQRLTPEHRSTIAGWPPSLTLDVDGVGDVFFCHAGPKSDTVIFTRLTADEHLGAMFGEIRAPIAVCGHTHMQFDRRVGALRIVNAGSVGMPFGEPGAYWLLLGPDPQLRRTDYDLAAAAARIRASGNPHADDFVARYVLEPPTEEEMLTRFAAAERK